MELKKIEDLLVELLGEHSSSVDDFSKKFIKNRHSTEQDIRNLFDFLKSFGYKVKNIAKHTSLLSKDIESAKEFIDFLYEKGFSSESIIKNIRLLNRNIQTLKRNWEFLEDTLKLSLDTLQNENFCLLNYSQENIQNKWDNLLALKLSTKQIHAHPRLLTRNPRAIKLKYKFLEFLGITPEKINGNCSLLLSDLTVLKNNFEFLRNLGIPPKKIANFPSLLYRNQEKILTHLKFLEELGLSSKNVKSQPILLIRDPLSIERNYNYLVHILGIDKSAIQTLPSLLMEHPDACAKKLRLLKSTIFGIKRNKDFNPKGYLIASPATLMAKKFYCNTHNIEVKNHKLKYTWDKLMKLIDPEIMIDKARELGKALVSPYKKKYDLWMRDYKIAAEGFYKRRGRRLLQKI